MKKALSPLLLFFCSAAISASIVGIAKGAGFMVCHLIGSLILLGFVFITAFKEEKITQWLLVQRVLAFLVSLYNVFLVTSLLIIVLVMLVEFLGPVNEFGTMLILPALLVALYTFLSFSYHRKVKKLKISRREMKRRQIENEKIEKKEP